MNLELDSERIGERSMANNRLYNNLGIAIVALSALLLHLEQISLAKIFLVMPFVTQKKLLQQLAKEENVKSIENLLSKKTSYFGAFSKRFYASLTLTMNALQYLVEMQYIKVEKGTVVKLKNYDFSSDIGERSSLIVKAAYNIALLLNTTREEQLYLNLRVKL